MGTNADTTLVSGVAIRIDGSELDPALAAQLIEVEIEDHRLLPSRFLVRITDPQLEGTDSSPFKIGSEVEIDMAGVEAATTTPTFTGVVTALEPEFGAEIGVVMAASGYDHSHALHRGRNTTTFQESTIGDVVQKVANEAGLSPGNIDDAGGVIEFMQQSNETGWEFLMRLGRMAGRVAWVDGKELNFTEATPDGPEISLVFGDSLTGFRPRVSGVQRYDEVEVRAWDPKTKDVITTTETADGVAGAIGISESEVRDALTGGTLRVSDAPVTSAEEASALAKGLAGELSGAWLDAEGECRGNPSLLAGCKVTIDGVGSSFGGTYHVTSSTHRFSSRIGYVTGFRATGTVKSELLDLIDARDEPGWDTSTIVVGVVTQNEDPDGLGRVRVKYPALDDDTEGWWARIATPSAGKERGLLMMPVVDEEVLVAFEHGDVRRPYVIGSLFNGKDTPGDDLVHTDGSYSLRSDENIFAEAKKEITEIAGEKMTIEVGQATVVHQKDGKVTIEGSDISVNGSGSIKLEARTSIDIKASGNISVQSNGVVSVSGSQVMLG